MIRGSIFAQETLMRGAANRSPLRGRGLIFAFVLFIFHFPFSIFLGEAQSATYYMDYANGSDSNDGSSWALAKKTINGYTAAIIVPGDTIRIAKSSAPTSLGITATWTNLSRTVTLASSLNGTVDLCETAWTASTNVTATTSTTRKEGSNAASLAIAAGFTTGVAAYKTIGSTNYSGYQQLSFWIRTNLQVNSGVLRIDLCSDTAGATPVDSFTINTTLYANQYYPLTIDKGSALGTAIQSVALYCISDPGTVTVLLDDIITAKASSSADALSLISLIGKNAANETWHGIKSINGTTVEVDLNVNSLAAAGQGYSGTTETVTTYKRETIKTTPAASASTFVQTVQDSGSAGSLITFSGGWNTGTTTQDGETWFDGQNGNGYGIYSTSKTYVKFEKIGVVRYFYGFTPSSDNTLDSCYAANNSFYGFNIANATNTLSTITANNNGNNGINLAGISGNLTSITSNNNFSGGIQVNGNSSVLSTITAKNNSSNGVVFSSDGNTLSSLTLKDNPTNLTIGGNSSTVSTATLTGGTNGISMSNCGNNRLSSITQSGGTTGVQFQGAFNNFFVDSTFSSNSSYDINVLYFADNTFYNCLFSSTTEIMADNTQSSPKSYIRSFRHDQTANRFKTWNAYSAAYANSRPVGIISDQVTGGQTAGWARGGSGYCLFLDPSNTTPALPVNWEFWIPVTASTSTTLSFYHRITSSFDGSLKATVYDSHDNYTKLINAATVTLTDNSDWNRYTSSSFTPTDTGFCRVVLQAYWGTVTGGGIGIDDVSISPDVNADFGGMDRWMLGLPPQYFTNATPQGGSSDEQSYGYVN